MGHLLYLLVWNFKGKIPKPLGPVVWMQCARGRLCFTPYWSLLLPPRKSSCLSKKSGGIFLWFKTLQLLLQQYKTTVKTLIMPNGTMISTLDPKLTFQKVPGIAYLILSLMLSFAALIPASQHWYATDALVRHQAPRCLNPSPPKYKGRASLSRANAADLLFLGCWSERKADSRHGSAGPHTWASTAAVLQQAAGAELLWDLEMWRSPACIAQYCRHSQNRVCRL